MSAFEDTNTTVNSLNTEKAVTWLLKGADEVKQLTVGEGMVGYDRVLAILECKASKEARRLQLLSICEGLPSLVKSITAAETGRIVKLLETAIKLLDFRAAGPCGNALLSGIRQERPCFNSSSSRRRSAGAGAGETSITDYDSASDTATATVNAKNENAAAAMLPLLTAFARDERPSVAVPWMKALTESLPTLNLDVLSASVVPLVGIFCRVETQEEIRLACCDLCVQLATCLGGCSASGTGGGGSKCSKGIGSSHGDGCNRSEGVGAPASDGQSGIVLQAAIRALCQDVAADVRMAMCRHMGSLFFVLSLEQQLTFLIPALVQSLDDEELAVRRCAYTALADGAGSGLRPPILSASAAPLMELYAMHSDSRSGSGCRSTSPSPSSSSITSTGNVNDGTPGSGGNNCGTAADAGACEGAVGASAANDDVGGGSDGAYGGTTSIAAELIGKVAFTFDSVATDEERSAFFAFFAWMHAGSAPLHYRKLAAFNLPAMMVVLSQRRCVMRADAFEDLALQLERALTALHDDADPTVRRILAAGYHELCRIASTFRRQTSKFYAAILIRLLRDLDVTVLVATAEHVDESLAALAELSSNSGGDASRMAGPRSSMSAAASASASATRSMLPVEILAAIRQCYNSLGPHWRSKVQLLEIFPLLSGRFVSHHSFSKAAPFLTSILLSIEPRPAYWVQQAALRAIVCLVQTTRRHEQRDYIHEWMVTELAEGQSAWLRILYVDLCSHAMHVFSRAYFKDHFFETLLILARDPVAEVRIRLCRLAGRLKMVLSLPLDRPYLKLLESGISRIVIGHPDNLALTEVANETLQTLESISVDSIWGNSEATDGGFIEDQRRLSAERTNFAEDGGEKTSKWKYLAASLGTRASSGGSFKSSKSPLPESDVTRLRTHAKVSKSAGRLSRSTSQGSGSIGGSIGGSVGGSVGGREHGGRLFNPPKKANLNRRLSSLSKEGLVSRRGSFAGIGSTHDHSRSLSNSPSTKRKISLLPVLASRRKPAAAAADGILADGRLHLGDVVDAAVGSNSKKVRHGGVKPLDSNPSPTTLPPPSSKEVPILPPIEAPVSRPGRQGRK